MAWTNTLAWTNKHTGLLQSLYITDVFIAQAPGVSVTKRKKGLLD
jgi:hypothetical protein